MTFRQLCYSFTFSRGGLIALSVLVAIVVRLLLWPVYGRDWMILFSIVLAWPVLEYIAHRYFMHEWILTPFRKTHDRHHDNPCPETGLPDLWVIYSYFINSVVLAFTTPGLYTAHVTILIMLLWYEFAHYACHTTYKPNTWWGWCIRANHLQHHSDLPNRYALLFPIFKERK